MARPRRDDDNRTGGATGGAGRAGQGRAGRGRTRLSLIARFHQHASMLAVWLWRWPTWLVSVAGRRSPSRWMTPST